MFFKLSSILSALSLTSPSEVVNDGVKQVAIIGAGAGGSAAAYYLQKFAEQGDLAVNITIFEKSDRIGGRTLTVNAYDDPLEPIELGASVFIEANHILFNATRDFDLALKEPDSDYGDLLGIWDGEKFVYTQDSSSWGWWNLAKLFWKYGTAPYKAQKLVQSTVDSFLQIYSAPHFPFKSLTQTAEDLGLLKIVGLTGTQFLADNEIGASFSHDIIQAATRVNYASNLDYIHGLETMVSMAPEGAMQVVGGNWQIFSHMLQKSNATLYQNTPVASISLKNQTEKYLIATQKHSTTDDESDSDQYPVAFDSVIVATPWQFAGIKAGEDVLQQTIDEIPYTRLHVTLFCSPFKLSPSYFNLGPGEKVPEAVLTTLGPDDEPKPGAEGVGRAGLYSISLLRMITNPTTGKEEYVYKIFSPQKIMPASLSDLLGAPVPDTIITTEGPDDEVKPISWYHTRVFNSYPIELPRVTFQESLIGKGLYYTSGMETFISTMETNALMGMNVARLIADEMLAELADKEKSTEEVLHADGQQKSDGKQDVLGADDEVVAPDEL